MSLVFRCGRTASPIAAMVLLAILMAAAARADTPDLTEYLLPPVPMQVACDNMGFGVMADVDGNGTSETMVVFNTLLNGEAYSVATTNHGGSRAYFFSGVNAHCGGVWPYQTGRFTIWFVDALAPGFVANQRATWTFTTVPGVRLVASSDLTLVGGQTSGYRQISAYTTRNQQPGTLVNSYTSNHSDPLPGPMADQTCTFSHAQGIAEVYLRTDFAENDVWSFVITSAPCTTPTITQQPQGATACPGDVTGFSVAGSSTAPISYQWYHDGGAVAGATGDVLTLDPVTASAEGEYWCVLSTSCGSITSAVAGLAVDCGSVVYRVNAGGPQVASGNGGPAWSADTYASPSIWGNAAVAGNAASNTPNVVDMSDPSVPAGTPVSLVMDERWDPASGVEMQWHFPADPGDYRVRLYCAEIYAGITSPGQRTFDVAINGQTVLVAFDMFAQAGGYKAFVREFPVTVSAAAGAVDIAFARRLENPTIGAIEIIRSCAAPVIGTQPQSRQACPGSPASFTVTATSIYTPSYQWYRDGTAIAGATGSTLSIAAVTAADAGAYTCRVSDGCGAVTSAPAVLSLSHLCGHIEYRVNAGGPQVVATDGGPNWSADTQGAPSYYVQVPANENATGSIASPIDMSDPSLPPGLPMSLLQDQRWDPPGGAEMVWQFPVDPGHHTVRLYFAETYWAITTAGQRVFDVTVNGQPVLPDLDLFAAAGQYKGFLRRCDVTVTAGDPNITIHFGHQAENPTIAAIEIYRRDEFRVNVGGAQVEATDGGAPWTIDTYASPSPYVNAAATGNATYSSGTPINYGHPSIPAGLPMAIFPDGRWDPPGSPEMAWRFPTGPGRYRVRLFLVDPYTAITGPGQRVFDVMAESQLALDNVDIWAETGGIFRALMKEFTIQVRDDALDLEFRHVAENPTVVAIEVKFVEDGVAATPEPPAAPTPAGARLDQNVPNPFNPKTTIAFELPRTGHARLQVFDLRGRLVSTLVDAELGAGRHQVDWDGRDAAGRRVAAGVYVYRLDGAGASETRRMLLLK